MMGGSHLSTGSRPAGNGRCRTVFVLPEDTGDWPMMCSSYPRCGRLQEYCFHCSHANWAGSGRDRAGRGWSWTFNPQFGPTFVGKRGTELVSQPGERSPVWVLFDLWQRKFNAAMEKQTAVEAAGSW